jgi:hypothetical protein
MRAYPLHTRPMALTILLALSALPWSSAQMNDVQTNTAQTNTAQAASPTVQTLEQSTVVTYLGRTPGWFICDGLDTPTVSEMGWPDSRGQSRLSVYSKAEAGVYSYRNYRVGRADPGAGQINYELTSSGVAPVKGAAPYHVGAFNTAGMPGALTPGVVTLDSAEVSGQCRWTVNTRLLGFDKRRSLQVTETPGGQLSYQVWNYADPVRVTRPDGVQRSSVPSLNIVGGSKVVSGSQEIFTFQNAGYTYTVRVARQGQPAGASVTVSRGGKVVQTEALTGYTYAARK